MYTLNAIHVAWKLHQSLRCAGFLNPFENHFILTGMWLNPVHTLYLCHDNVTIDQPRALFADYCCLTRLILHDDYTVLWRFAPRLPLLHCSSVVISVHSFGPYFMHTLIWKLQTGYLCLQMHYFCSRIEALQRTSFAHCKTILVIEHIIIFATTKYCDSIFTEMNVCQCIWESVVFSYISVVHFIITTRSIITINIHIDRSSQVAISFPKKNALETLSTCMAGRWLISD